ncbi:DUF4349 domain-containing protein [Stieleria varia]|uniref:DUF4349 domain-containing protein n=1 Tax=Stieleria varia TaxID=2528005 RepID=A0A5C6B6H6_9BACT|nr:DUF4349 domain-containing protein [Stieleria varia]TWU07663.1 hypothetical protein Pla52n_02360 [Stieleria varia]
MAPSHRRISLPLLTVFCFWISGCGANPYEQIGQSHGYDSVDTESLDYDDVTTSSNEKASSEAVQLVSTSGSAADANRRIIYTSTIGLIVQDYTAFESALPRLVSQLGGYISKRDTNRQYSDQQSGSWIVRVPVENYHDLMGGVAEQGFAESRQENAQDVTEEFVDITARVANKRELEKRILKMLDERTGKLTDVLSIENELARVREEIERMEGRMRYLSDRTTLATVTINCRERAEYQPAAAPTFASRIGDSWVGSLGSLLALFQQLVIFVVAIIPWLALVLPAVYIARRVKGMRVAA